MTYNRYILLLDNHYQGRGVVTVGSMEPRIFEKCEMEPMDFELLGKEGPFLATYNQQNW